MMNPLARIEIFLAKYDTVFRVSMIALSLTILVFVWSLLLVTKSCEPDPPPFDPEEDKAVLCDYVCIETRCEWYCEDPQIAVACNHCDYVCRSGKCNFDCVQCDVGTY